MYSKSLVALLLTGIFLISVSCQKNDDYGFNNDKLVLKGQEITLYYHGNEKCSEKYLSLIPAKLYARGGAPQHSNGDYYYSVPKNSRLPQGMRLDPLNGVLEADGIRIIDDDKLENFAIQVTDGKDTTIANFTLVKKLINDAKSIPPLQFSAPETTLLCKSNRGNYGVSLSMFSGTPPYCFKLADGEVLPSGLSLNPKSGVISGYVENLQPGRYIFRIECTDATGNKAVSMCTAQKYEEFTFIVK